jgi:hypothetical protein
MKATNSKIQMNSVAPFRELVSFDESDVDIKSTPDFGENWSQKHSIEDKKTRSNTSKKASSIHTLRAHQAEIKKLKNTIKQLQHEKSILVKWLHFLF